jgi:hypothetical protein
MKKIAIALLLKRLAFRLRLESLVWDSASAVFEQRKLGL